MKMTKLLLTMLPIASLLMTSCKDKTETNNLSILVPTGGPAIAFYKYAEDPKFQTNNNPGVAIKNAVVAEEIDVAVLPTNLCFNLIQKQHVNYKLAATITFGNFYLVSTGHDNDQTLNEGDYIVLFQNNNLPDYLFHYVFGDSYNETIRYVGSSNDAERVLTSDNDLEVANGLGEPVDYVLISEPNLTRALTANTNCSLCKNMTDEYKTKSGASDLFQASIIISNNVARSEADKFLDNIEKDIRDARENPELIEDGMKKADQPSMFYGIDPTLAKNLTANGNKLAIGFKRAKDNKQSIDAFLSLFNLGETNEEIYY